MNIPEFVRDVVDKLSRIEGITAVSLGGSLARSQAHSGSDIDLGLYYDPKHPPSVRQLSLLAKELDDRHADDLVTPFGEWGVWINGGGWLKIQRNPVDWLYRDIAFVSKVIADCIAGQTNCHYYPGHPHGFHDHYYLADIYYCYPLCDTEGLLATLKEKVKYYPPLLKKTLIEKYRREADFSLQAALKAAERDDIFYVVGCFFRCVACFVQVLFALNERYINNEKGAMRTADTFALCPDNFRTIVSAILANPGSKPREVHENIKKLENLLEEIKKLPVGNGN